MLVDNLDYFKLSTDATSDALATSGATGAASGPRYYPPQGKYADGFGEKIVEILCTAIGTAFSAGNVVFNLEHSDSEGSGYVTAASVTLAFGAIALSQRLASFRLPTGLKKYLRLSIVTTGVTGAGTFKARIVHG